MRYDKLDLETSLANSTYAPLQAAPEGVRIRLGTQKRVMTPIYWTPEDAKSLDSPNIVIVGGEDMGNTQMVHSVALQLLRQKTQSGESIGLLLFDGLDDYSDSHASFVDSTGAQVLHPHKLPLNPFSLRFLARMPQLHTHRAMAFADALARAYGLGALQKSTLVQAIVAAYAARGITADPLTWDLCAPTLEDVYTEYCSRPQSQRSDDLAQVLENLSLLELFDANASADTSLYDMVQGTVILDMSGYPETLKHFALGIVLETLCAQMLSRERAVGGTVQKMIFIDNADRLLSSGCPGLEILLSQGREFGLGLLLSVQSLDVFRCPDFDYLAQIPAWVLHNVENLRKTDLEYLLQIDISDGDLARLYQESRHLPRLHSLIHIGAEEPVLAEDLAFYEIVSDAAQSYLIQETPALDPEPLAGMPLLDSADLSVLVNLDDVPAGPMGILEEL